jgi:hypothetical protein
MFPTSLRIRLQLGLALSLALLLGSIPSAARADAPIGTFDFEFGDEAPVFGLPASGLLDDIVEGVDCGKLRGGLSGDYEIRCTLKFDESGVRGNFEGKVRISFASVFGGTRLIVRMKMDGSVEGGGERYQATMKGKARVVIPPGALSAPISLSVRVCLVDDGDKVCQSLTENSVVEFEEGAGDWSLRLHLYQVEGHPNKLTGGAIARVGEHAIRYKVKGRVDPDTGLATLKLKPRKKKSRKHSRIRLSNVEVEEGTLTADLSYRLYGQSGSLIPATGQSSP